MSDHALQEHVNKVNDVRQIIDKDNFSFMVSKPILPKNGIQ
jgi:hypothetical protein